MAGIAIGDLEIRLSGGASQAVTTLSLGGVMSSVVVLSQSTTAPGVTGVVLDNAIGNAIGAGNLAFFFVAIAQIQSLTKNADFVTGNIYSVDVDGVNITQNFDTDNDTTLAALAVKIAAQAGVTTAVVTNNGTNDNEIVITAAVAGTAVVIENFQITGGASQATPTLSVTTGNAASDSLAWTPLGGGAVDAVFIDADGTFTINSSTGGILVATVTKASLPGADDLTNSVTIADLANLVYDDVAKAESAAGDTEYRGLYVFNGHPTETATNVTIWLKQDSNGPDAIAMADGGEAVNVDLETVANENTAPSGESFTAPTTQATGINLGTLTAGQRVGFWLRRTVPAANTVSAPNATSRIGISALL